MINKFCRFAAFLTFFALGCINAGQPIAPSQPGVPGAVVSRVMRYDGAEYPFVVYVPTTYDLRTPLPALLLVHGAGGNGPAFLENWRAFAETNGIILVAPTLDLSAQAETKVPMVFPRIMDTVQKEWNVDPSRRYLFGYSGGGYFVYDAALLNSDYFAGAGIFAAVIQPEYDGIARQAPRKTGIAIYLCDHDQYFSMKDGRRTRDLLIANGMDVHYTELANCDHNYSAVANIVNEDAWKFLASRSLP